MEADRTGVAGLRVVVSRWRALPARARWPLLGVALVLGANLLIVAVAWVTGGQGAGGPASSSYATGHDGLAAYAELLSGRGHPVGRLGDRLDQVPLDPAGTVVVADPRELVPADAEALHRFVAAGGRIVAAGPDVVPGLQSLLGDDLAWERAAGGRAEQARPLAPVPEVADVAGVCWAGAGAWRDAAASLPVLGSDHGVLATVATVGDGRVVALADASVLQNRFLDCADNAAFALAAAGEARRPVAFAEAQHGYGNRTGIGALPARWRWALGGGALAALVAMWSKGRRLGPPEQAERELAPSRRAYVDALAVSLARTRQPEESTEPLRAAARRRLALRAGLPGGADDHDLRRAAQRLGTSAEDVDALFSPARSDAEVMAVAGALARLEGGAR